MRIRPILPVVVVAVLVVASLIVERLRPEPAQGAASVADAAPAPEAAPARGPSFIGRIAAAQRLSAAPSSKPAPPWRAMRARFAGAPNLRAFFYDALQKPKEGGYYYASQVLALCGAGAQNDSDDLPAPRRDAIEALRNRCDFSMRELDDAGRQFQGTRDLDLTADPILGRIFAYLRTKDYAARVAVLDAAIDDGNPDVIGAIVSRAIESRVAATIDRDPQAASDDARHVMLLVECQLGQDCGEHSMLTLQLCTQHGWCAGNVRDALRDGLGGRFDAIEQLATQVTANIRKRNYGPLLTGH